MKHRQFETAYYYLDEALQIHADADYLCAEDNHRWAVGNYFLSMTEARAAAKQTLALWQNLSLDNNS